MRVLVTGGAGFIGSHLTRALLSAGHEVVVVDSMNEYYDRSLKEARLAQFRDDVMFYELDITDTDAFSNVFTNHRFDAVCHLAAQAGVRYSLEHPLIYGTTNVDGMLNVLEFSKRTGVSHVVFASSSSVYGSSGRIPFREDDPADAPVSVYGASKRAGELFARTYADLFDLPVTCLRLFSVYGPYGRPDLAFFSFTKATLEGVPIDVYNSGMMKRDFTYVGDVVRGFLLALEKPSGFQICNIGYGRAVPLLDFIKVIEEKLGRRAKLNLLPMQPGDVPETYADTKKARKALGFQAQVPIEEGIGKFVEWYREYYRV